VVHTIVDEDGVFEVQMGHLVSGRMLRIVVQCVEQFVPEVYARYRAIKRPNGPGSATPETRKAAYAYALERFSAFVLDFYVRREA
jgi:hypothetical protein